ncbi:MAG TPA: hypothetical protein VFZ53_07835 [Polyangiaceae bacterium]
MDPLSLAWHAPSDCPTGASVTRAVEMLITRPPARTLEAELTIRKKGERYAAEIKTPRGERKLDGESCRAVSEAVAMVLALAIDPDASPSDAAFAAFDEPDVTAPVDSSVAERAPAPPPAAATPAPPRRDEPRALPSRADEPAGGTRAPRFIAAAFGLVEVGMLPQATFGASLGLGIAFGRFSAELGPMALLPRAGSLEDNPEKGGEIDYLGGHAAACFTPFAARRLDACATFEVGRLAGTGFGVTEELSGEALWLGPGLFGAGRLPIAAGFEGQARVGAALALNRPEFVLDELGNVHRPALVSLRAELGFSFR